jgi:carbon starvation protein CstA
MSAAFGKKSSLQTKFLWTAVVILGVVSFGIVALNRGESVNAAWLVVAAVCVYFVAYRFYGLLVANRALGVDGERPTPAHRHNDGLDYVPTNLYVLYGHHFAAIAGAGPLVGPVLAAQMGYLPGTLWILVGAVFAGADLQMPAMTKFIDGTGPVWSGSVFPFLFITIACGAVSGWHSLIASGTTPKMIENESQIALIGYGGMLMESFVAIMAMIGASVIHPGVYFAMNSSAGLIGTSVDHAAQVISSWGFVVTPNEIAQVAKNVGETTILSRTGGAPTLAVGMASILSGFLGGPTLMGIWYHFAILFEALFILTTVDAGTRVLRFMIQDLVGNAVPAFKETASWTNNLIGSGLSVALWGYFLYAGVIDPFGGIWTLWPLFGTANQMLAAIALTVCTVVLFKMKRERYALVTIMPATWLVACTVTAGLQKVLSPDPKVGFVSHALQYGEALATGQLVAPAKTIAEMTRIVVNDYIDATLSAVFVLVVVATVIYGLISIRKALASPQATAMEIGFVGMVIGGRNA